ncbi:MAG: DUF427 domain-containing protein [Solirubrobacterales bacterium]
MGESVWDYPRPPRVEPSARRVRVVFGGETIAESDDALRVLETSHPPGIYVPPGDVHEEFLRPGGGRSLCEFKGSTSFFDLIAGGQRAERAAWTYRHPARTYASLADHVAFYPGMAECYLGDERVQAQAGRFYGGWITSDLEGPFKGEPGTEGW